MREALIFVCAFAGSFVGAAVYNKLTRDPILATYVCSCGRVNWRWAMRRRTSCKCGLTYQWHPLGRPAHNGHAR